MLKLYSLNTCPKCDIVKAKFKEANISFKEVSSKEDLEANGITGVPVLEFRNGEKILFQDIIKLIKENSKKLMEAE